MSGIREFVEGTWDFRIYLLKSGSTVRGQGAIGAGFIEATVAAAAAAAGEFIAAQPHDFLGLLHLLHTGTSESSSAHPLNPSLAPPTLVN
jgi:hypothetical protein